MAASAAFQSSLVAATRVDESGPKTVRVGFARTPVRLNEVASVGPTARITTRLFVVPVMQKPAVKASAPVPTRESVETFANLGSCA